MNDEDVKVGQRVRYGADNIRVGGYVGTCIYNAPDGWVAVEFDESSSNFHTCDGRCEDGHGYWCLPYLLTPVEEEVVDNSTPCAPPPVEVTTNDREMSSNQVDVLDNSAPCAVSPLPLSPIAVNITRLEDVVETFFTIGVSRQDMLELFNDISKKHFSEKQLRDKIATIKDKVTKCQN